MYPGHRPPPGFNPFHRFPVPGPLSSGTLSTGAAKRKFLLYGSFVLLLALLWPSRRSRPPPCAPALTSNTLRDAVVQDWPVSVHGTEPCCSGRNLLPCRRSMHLHRWWLPTRPHRWSHRPAWSRCARMPFSPFAQTRTSRCGIVWARLRCHVNHPIAACVRACVRACAGPVRGLLAGPTATGAQDKRDGVPGRIERVQAGQALVSAPLQSHGTAFPASLEQRHCRLAGAGLAPRAIRSDDGEQERSARGEGKAECLSLQSGHPFGHAGPRGGGGADQGNLDEQVQRQRELAAMAKEDTEPSAEDEQAAAVCARVPLVRSVGCLRLSGADGLAAACGARPRCACLGSSLGVILSGTRIGSCAGASTWQTRIPR